MGSFSYLIIIFGVENGVTTLLCVVCCVVEDARNNSLLLKIK
jgi:hypothetical protein